MKNYSRKLCDLNFNLSSRTFDLISKFARKSLKQHPVEERWEKLTKNTMIRKDWNRDIHKTTKNKKTNNKLNNHTKRRNLLLFTFWQKPKLAFTTSCIYFNQSDIARRARSPTKVLFKPYKISLDSLWYVSAAEPSLACKILKNTNSWKIF